MSLKIAFYAPMKPPDHLTPSGDRTIARLIVTALQRAGYSVHLVSEFRSWAATPEGQGRLRDQARTERQRASDRISRLRPDLWLTYHLSYKAPDWLGPALSRRYGLPYLVAEASDAPSRLDGAWSMGVADVRAALQTAQRIFLMKERDRPALEQLPGTAVKLVSLPPFADMTGWPEVRRASRAGPVRLLAVAMMRDGDKLRSYRLLAAALSGVREPWTLTIAGDGPAREVVRNLFAPFGPRTRFTGALDVMQMPALYHDADGLVWPGIGEAIGMVYLEAQATGLPVVACRTACVPEFVVNGQTGILSRSTDPPAFAAAISALIARPGRRERMGRAAAARMRTHHGIEGAAGCLHRTMTNMRAIPA